MLLHAPALTPLLAAACCFSIMQTSDGSLQSL
jgi:hypothetical protein